MDKEFELTLRKTLTLLLSNMVTKIVTSSPISNLIITDNVSNIMINQEINQENEQVLKKEILKKLKKNFIPREINQILQLLQENGFNTPKDIKDGESELKCVIGKHLQELEQELINIIRYGID